MNFFGGNMTSVYTKCISLTNLSSMFHSYGNKSIDLQRTSSE